MFDRFKFSIECIEMNGAFLLNLMMVLVGAGVLLVACHFGARLLPASNWLRKWTLALLERRGPLEAARMVGLMVLIVSLAALAIAES